MIYQGFQVRPAAIAVKPDRPLTLRELTERLHAGYERLEKFGLTMYFRFTIIR